MEPEGDMNSQSDGKKGFNWRKRKLVNIPDKTEVESEVDASVPQADMFVRC